jgi:hypothetical protein
MYVRDTAADGLPLSFILPTTLYCAIRVAVNHAERVCTRHMVKASPWINVGAINICQYASNGATIL